MISDQNYSTPTMHDSAFLRPSPYATMQEDGETMNNIALTNSQRETMTDGIDFQRAKSARGFTIFMAKVAEEQQRQQKPSPRDGLDIKYRRQSPVRSGNGSGVKNMKRMAKTRSQTNRDLQYKMERLQSRIGKRAVKQQNDEDLQNKIQSKNHRLQQQQQQQQQSPQRYHEEDPEITIDLMELWEKEIEEDALHPQPQRQQLIQADPVQRMKAPRQASITSNWQSSTNGSQLPQRHMPNNIGESLSPPSRTGVLVTSAVTSTRPLRSVFPSQQAKKLRMDSRDDDLEDSGVVQMPNTTRSKVLVTSSDIESLSSVEDSKSITTESLKHDNTRMGSLKYGRFSKMEPKDRVIALSTNSNVRFAAAPGGSGAASTSSQVAAPVGDVVPNRSKYATTDAYSMRSFGQMQYRSHISMASQMSMMGYSTNSELVQEIQADERTAQSQKLENSVDDDDYDMTYHRNTEGDDTSASSSDTDGQHQLQQQTQFIDSSVDYTSNIVVDHVHRYDPIGDLMRGRNEEEETRRKHFVRAQENNANFSKIWGESIGVDSKRQNESIANSSRGGRGLKKIHAAMAKLFYCGGASQHDDECDCEYDDYLSQNDKVNMTQRIDIIRRNNGTRASF